MNSCLLSRNSTQSDILIRKKLAELQISNPNTMENLTDSGGMLDLMDFTIKDIMHLPEQQRMEIIEWICRPTRKTSLDANAIDITTPKNSPVDDNSKVFWQPGASMLSNNGHPSAHGQNFPDNCSDTMLSYSQSNFGGFDLQSTLFQKELDIANMKGHRNSDICSPTRDPRVGKPHLSIGSCGKPRIINVHALGLLDSPESPEIKDQVRSNAHLRHSSNPVGIECREFSPVMNWKRPHSSLDVHIRDLRYITANTLSPNFGDYVMNEDVITEEDDVDLISLPTERHNSNRDSPD